MNFAKNVTVFFTYVIFLLVAYGTNAADISSFEATCLDIGFKKKTEAYADCVIELITRDKQAKSALHTTKQKDIGQHDVLKSNKSKSQPTRSSTKSIKPIDNNPNRESTTASSEAGRETAEHEHQTRLLNLLHPDWEELASSDDFATWKKTLSIDEQEALQTSWDAMGLAKYFTQFKNWKNSQVAPEFKTNSDGIPAPEAEARPMSPENTMTLPNSKFRQYRDLHPEYSSMSDADLFDAIYQTDYSQYPRDKVAQLVGYEDPKTAPGTARNLGLAFDKNVVGVGGVLESTGKMDINMWFLQLLAYALPSTILMYVFGALLIYKIRLTIATKIVGFFVAWLVTVITALLMADKKTVLSAELEMFPAAAIGVIVALFVVSVAGRRTPSTR